MQSQKRQNDLCSFPFNITVIQVYAPTSNAEEAEQFYEDLQDFLECSNYHTVALISHARKVMLKILQARLQKYMKHELPDVQAGSRKGRGTRGQIANICWIIKKAREFQKNIYFCFIDYAKAFDCVDHNKLWKILRDGNARPPDLPAEKTVCRSGSNT